MIVLDPATGASTGGRPAKKGTEEKAVNLAFGLALRSALEALPDIKVVMTRDDDTFIPLNERAAIARRAGANLMVSLHADSIRYKDSAGATVYTLSEKASDSLSRELADTENSADRFAGSEWDKMRRRSTTSCRSRPPRDGSALRAFRDPAGRRSRQGRNPADQQSAPLGRLPVCCGLGRSLDPSGDGLSLQPEDEQALQSEDWQKRLAAILARSIAEFAKRPTLGSQR